jgi:hypothetical protein
MTKLTSELQEKFLKLLELGVPIKYACESLSIDESTYFVWMKLGKKKTEGKYFEFFKSVETIPGKAMACKLAHLEKAAEKGSVSACIWFLEHKYPEIFKQATDLNLNVKPDVTQFIAFLEMRDKEKEKKKEDILESK